MATTRPRRPASTTSDPSSGTTAPAETPARPPANPATDVDAILKRAVEEAARLLRTDGAMSYLLDEATGILHFAYDAGITDDRRRDWVQSLKIDVGIGMFGRAVADGQVVVTGDYPNDPSFIHFPDADRLVSDIEIRSFVVAPLVSGERTFGAMGTFSSRLDAFGDAEVALVRALADHAAAAMANADLIEQLGRSRAEVEHRAEAERALREIGGRIIALRNPAEVLQRSVDEAARLLGADGARIDVLDEASGALYWAYDARTGRRPGLGPIAGTGEAKAGEGISGRAVRALRPVFTGDYINDDRFEHAAGPDAHVRKHQIRSAVAVPLIGDRGPLGTLTVYTAEPDAFGPDDARLIEALAGQAAIAMTNARLIEELDRSRDIARRQAEAERTLREIAARITAIRDPSDLLQHVVDEAARLLGAERIRIDLVKPAAGRVGFTHVPGAGDVIGGAAVDAEGVPFRLGASGRAIATGRTVVSTDYLIDDGFEHDPALDEAVRLDGVRSLIVAPLTGEEGLLGVLQAGWPEPSAFEPEEVGLVEALAHQAAIAIQNARLIEALALSREEIRRRARAEQALREIAARITAIRDPGDLLGQVVDTARDLLGADRAQLDLVQPESGLIRWAFVSGEGDLGQPGPGAVQGLPGDRGINGPAIAQRRAIVTGDYLTDDRFVHVEDSDAFVRAVGLHSVVAAPLFTSDGLLGVIKVSSTRRNAYDDEDAALMEAFADQAVIAIQNARLIEELGRSREELSHRADAERSVRQIAANISAIRDPDAVLQQTVDEARRLLDSDTARIDMVEGDTLTWTYASGGAARATREANADIISKVGEGVTGTAVARGRPFRTGDYLADEGFVHLPASDLLVSALGLRSVLSAPLLGETGALGSLSVSSTRQDAYDDAAAELLQALADQAAITIQNARLIEELERSQAALEARAETERSLRDITARITSLRDADEILARVVEESRRLLGSDGAHLTRIAEDGTYLVPVFVAGGMDEATEAWLRRTRFPLGGGINGLAAEEIRPIWTYDYGLDPRIPHEPDDVAVAERLGLRAMAAAPLRAPAGEVIGTLAISYREPREIAPDELDLLQGLADQAAIALTNSNLYELLGESEARYRYLVQNSPDLVWSIDADARFTFVSDTCERLTGWRPEDLLGKHFGALVHDTSKDVAEIDWTAGLSADFQEIRGRLNLLHRDGHAIPAEFSAFGTLDETGSFAGANGSVRDMSERDRLERELRESEERYRFLVENAPDIIFSIDTAGNLIYVSESVHRALGYPPEELVGRPFRDIIHYADPSQAGLRWSEMEADPSLEITSRLMLIHRDGRRLPFEASSRGVVVDGVFAGIHGSARDVSERERLERELRESEERYRFLTENSPDVVFATDGDGMFTYLSETIDRMTGHAPAELVGKHFSQIVDEGSWPAAFERWSALIAEPDREQVVRLNLVHREQGLVPVEVSAIGTTVDGQFVGIHGATRDVSERERLEQGLRRQAGELASSQERAHLARELHDSVTQALFSMTLVTRTTELLVDRDPVAAKEKLGSLRDLQREALAEMRALIFELRPGNIEHDGLLPALKTHTAALQGRIGLPIVVTSDLASRLPLALEEVLYRISQEALHNVVKHAAAHQVTLSIDRGVGGVRLRIVDDGKGFDAATVPDGHLGLAGMRARADKIGASFQVTSKPGAGTTIEVTVPESVIASVAAASPSSPAVSSAE